MNPQQPEQNETRKPFAKTALSTPDTVNSVGVSLRTFARSFPTEKTEAVSRGVKINATMPTSRHPFSLLPKGGPTNKLRDHWSAKAEARTSTWLCSSLSKAAGILDQHQGLADSSLVSAPDVLEPRTMASSHTAPLANRVRPVYPRHFTRSLSAPRSSAVRPPTRLNYQPHHDPARSLPDLCRARLSKSHLSDHANPYPLSARNWVHFLYLP